jgi:hypothetical protein
MAKNIDFMMEMVNDYLSGKMPRHIFELDFQTEILDLTFRVLNSSNYLFLPLYLKIDKNRSPLSFNNLCITY